MPSKRTKEERLRDYKEIYRPADPEQLNQQAARCMDCGVPFCHSGCPLGNLIPDFNDAVYRNDLKRAYELLRDTNNFPEFTGRICPAPCEAACVLGINSDAVTIEHIEKEIIETAYAEGWVKPQPPRRRTNRKVAVVGSGPAGLAAADQLNQAGHEVTVFEKSDRIGGLLRYGIPDFKLEKHIIDRRLDIMQSEGIRFRTNAEAGGNVPLADLQTEYDAVLLCCGAGVPRDLPIPGRELQGVHFAMDFLEQKNRSVAGQTRFTHPLLTAADKNVVVIGGGDTGADCVGTSNREKAKSVTQIELLTKPPAVRHESTPWPLWPMQLRTSTSHEEGCDRQWAILTKAFVGDADGCLTGIKTVNIEWKKDPITGRNAFVELPNTERIVPCELALLAVGFLHTRQAGIVREAGLETDKRGNIVARNYHTSVPGIFAAGDMRRGQSLVVWAISEGREAAVAIDEHLSRAASVLRGKESARLLV